MGLILLEGGAEFQGPMAGADRRAIELAGGKNNARISIVPAAAAPDNNHQKAGDNGVNWFKRLGAHKTQTLPIIDHQSANNPALASTLSRSDMVFLLGGFPGHLALTLKNSLCWQAMQRVHANGGIIAGSSAGAMVLCEYFYDPAVRQIEAGLNRIQNACVLPHHDTFGHTWVSGVRQYMPNGVLIGIDEGTGMLNDGPEGSWQVYGQGVVTLYRGQRPETFCIDQPFTL